MERLKRTAHRALAGGQGRKARDLEEAATAMFYLAIGAVVLTLGYAILTFNGGAL